MPKFGAPTDPPTWTETNESSADSVKIVSHAAETGRRHYVTAFEAVLRAAAATGDVKIEVRDGATVKWTTYFGDAAVRGERVGVVFAHPIEMSVGAAARVAATAGGSSCIVVISFSGYTR